MAGARMIARAAAGERLAQAELWALAETSSLDGLLGAAAARRDAAHGRRISFSPKVFIPLTQLCRNVCHYCTFAHPPRAGEEAFLSPEKVLAIAEAGRNAGCREALFTLGDKPELRYTAARRALEGLGYASTIDYLAAMCRLVLEKTGLLPHVNAGVMTAGEIGQLRQVSVSQGLMLESVSERLCAKGMAHHGSPDKHPAARLATIEAAGVQAVPFTSGILIGIGETRRERIESLLALRALNDRYGHLQEVIIQNFRAKPGTRMAASAEPDLEDHLWTIAMARLAFDAGMNLQAPPNLWSQNYPRLLGAGINDWGGISPVTPDHVNPEAAWPHLDTLRARTEAEGFVLAPRLAIYPSYLREGARWLHSGVVRPVLEQSDGSGMARDDAWRAGRSPQPPVFMRKGQGPLSRELMRTLSDAQAGKRLDEQQAANLFEARGSGFRAVCEAASELRAEVVGDNVTYVVNRNINYTNLCSYRCTFCAFSKGKTNEVLRGAPYDLAPEEISRRVKEAWDRGATEVCMQGGIHPDYTGRTYLEILRIAKAAVPGIHVHAFSPLEIWQGAASLGLPVREFLQALRDAGLGSLPGTAAEILEDRVRATLCPDKLNTALWLDVVRAAHEVGLPTTATIMFGHVDGYEDWARHLLRIRDLQAETHGFTEFVPLPFVAHEAPLYLRGQARPGPTFREAVLMHAVARLVLHPLIPNIQASWTKMSPAGARACLEAGANDLGGTLMNESISRAAGAAHGQELPPAEMERLAAVIGRTAVQRSTLYKSVDAERRRASLQAAPLSAPINTPAAKNARLGSALRFLTQQL
jgi:FO synthase